MKKQLVQESLFELHMPDMEYSSPEVRHQFYMIEIINNLMRKVNEAKLEAITKVKVLKESDPHFNEIIQVMENTINELKSKMALYSE